MQHQSEPMVGPHSGGQGKGRYRGRNTCIMTSELISYLLRHHARHSAFYICLLSPEIFISKMKQRSLLYITLPRRVDTGVVIGRRHIVSLLMERGRGKDPPGLRP